MTRPNALLLVALTSLGSACVSSSSPPPPPVVESGAVDRLLEEFTAASATFDVERMTALFLPPDDTPAGENRRLHLEAMQADWPAAQAEGRDLQVTFRDVTFDDVTGLVTAELVARSGPDGGVQLVEFLVAPTPDGLKIGAMRMPRVAGP